MALYFTIQATVDPFQSATLAEVAIIRQSDSDAPPAADDVFTYRVDLDDREIGTVAHRYGDGGYALAVKALQLVDEVRLQPGDVVEMDTGATATIRAQMGTATEARSWWRGRHEDGRPWMVQEGTVRRVERAGAGS